ncbi:MAG: nucleotidyltransferase family protein [Chloroflexota bacterium]|nr:nucleotidyltransferase family protein [Chloroflexota bacterium]
MLCRTVLTSDETRRIRALVQGPVDWTSLARLAELHEVTGLVRHNLATLDLVEAVPEKPRQRITDGARQISFDMMVQARQAVLVLNRLEEAGIHPVYLKGIALADMVYGDFTLRPSIDIDLLVEKRDLEDACRVMQSLGFLDPEKDFVDFHLANGYALNLHGRLLTEQPLAVEVHWALSPRGLIPLDYALLRRRSEIFAIEGTPATRFSPEDMLLHQAMHLRKHRFVGLRWLCDAAELIRRFDTLLDWEYIVASSQSAGISTLLYAALSLSSDLLDSPVPPGVLDATCPSLLRRRVLSTILPEDMLAVPEMDDKEGWTRLAMIEVLLLDRPAAMWQEFRFRMFPPPEGSLGIGTREMSRSQRLGFQARRLARRSVTMLSK